MSSSAPRRPKFFLAAGCVALTLGLLGLVPPISTGGGGQALTSSTTSPSPVSVYLGFGYTINGFGGTFNQYDNLPAPWPASTSSPVTYNGYSVYANSSDNTSTSTYDSGAIMIENTSGLTETISNLSVTIGSTVYSGLWASQTLTASEAMAAYQTTSTTNFNTASGDTSCTTPTTTVPLISFTVTQGSYSGLESFSDTGLVLTDNGLELYGGGSTCLNQGDNSEGEAWTPIGDRAALPPSGESVTPAEVAGSCGGPETECASSNSFEVVSPQGVNTEDGDLSTSYNGFSAPALGHPLNFDLTYDSSIGQVQAGASLSGGAAGMFGPGWSDGNTPSITLSSSYASSTTSALGSTATLNTGDGAEASYVASSSTGSCITPSGTTYEPYWGDIANSDPNDAVQTMCSEPRVDAWMSYLSGSGDYLVGYGGGQQTQTFTPTGNIAYFGTAADADFVAVTLDASPGSDDCPAATGANSWITGCVVYTDASGRQMAVGVNSSGESQGAWNVDGNEWTIDYNGQSNLKSVTDPLSRKTGYTYDSGNSNTSLQNDLLTAKSPARARCRHLRNFKLSYVHDLLYIQLLRTSEFGDRWPRTRNQLQLSRRIPKRFCRRSHSRSRSEWRQDRVRLHVQRAATSDKRLHRRSKTTDHRF